MAKIQMKSSKVEHRKIDEPFVPSVDQNHVTVTCIKPSGLNNPFYFNDIRASGKPIIPMERYYYNAIMGTPLNPETHAKFIKHRMGED